MIAGAVVAVEMVAEPLCRVDDELRLARKYPPAVLVFCITTPANVGVVLHVECLKLPEKVPFDEKVNATLLAAVPPLGAPSTVARLVRPIDRLLLRGGNSPPSLSMSRPFTVGDVTGSFPSGVLPVTDEGTNFDPRKST